MGREKKLERGEKGKEKEGWLLFWRKFCVRLEGFVGLIGLVGCGEEWDGVDGVCFVEERGINGAFK